MGGREWVREAAGQSRSTKATQDRWALPALLFRLEYQEYQTRLGGSPRPECPGVVGPYSAFLDEYKLLPCGPSPHVWPGWLLVSRGPLTRGALASSDRCEPKLLYASPYVAWLYSQDCVGQFLNMGN